MAIGRLSQIVMMSSAKQRPGRAREPVRWRHAEQRDHVVDDPVARAIEVQVAPDDRRGGERHRRGNQVQRAHGADEAESEVHQHREPERDHHGRDDAEHDELQRRLDRRPDERVVEHPPVVVEPDPLREPVRDVPRGEAEREAAHDGYDDEDGEEHHVRRDHQRRRTTVASCGRPPCSCRGRGGAHAGLGLGHLWDDDGSPCGWRVMISPNAPRGERPARARAGRSPRSGSGSGIDASR